MMKKIRLCRVYFLNMFRPVDVDDPVRQRDLDESRKQGGGSDQENEGQTRKSTNNRIQYRTTSGMREV